MDFELQALISTEDGSSSAKPTSTGTQQGQLSHTTRESKNKNFETELPEATSDTVTNTVTTSVLEAVRTSIPKKILREAEDARCRGQDTKDRNG